MYRLSVRDHFMIAHSFTGEIFGPAQRMHGATYVVDLQMRRIELDGDGLIVDIGLASQALKSVLEALNFQNLDEVPQFKGQNTTTEFLARDIFDRVVQRIGAGELGESAKALDSLQVTLHESHVAWASYEGTLSGD